MLFNGCSQRNNPVTRNKAGDHEQGQRRDKYSLTSRFDSSERQREDDPAKRQPGRSPRSRAA